jgi:hypothetical protein
MLSIFKRGNAMVYEPRRAAPHGNVTVIEPQPPHRVTSA